MNCEYYEDLLSAQLDGELTREEASMVAAHLETCPACRAYARQLEVLHKDLGALSAEPPSTLTEAILKETRGLPMKKTLPQRLRRWSSLACAAVLTLVLVGSLPALLSGGSDAETAAATEGGESAAPQELVPEQEESAAADTESMEGAPAPSAQAGEGEASPSPLTQAEALAALEDALARREPAPALTALGLSQDGSSWLFSDDETGLIFSVSRTDGEIEATNCPGPLQFD